MKRGARVLVTSKRQTICIFCASHVQPVSARRGLHFTKSSPKSSENTTVTSEEKRDESSYATRSPPPSSGAWGSAATRSGLSPEEEAARAALQKRRHAQTGNRGFVKSNASFSRPAQSSAARFRPRTRHESRQREEVSDGIQDSFQFGGKSGKLAEQAARRPEAKVSKLDRNLSFRKLDPELSNPHGEHQHWPHVRRRQLEPLLASADQSSELLATSAEQRSLNSRFVPFRPRSANFDKGAPETDAESSSIDNSTSDPTVSDTNPILPPKTQRWTPIAASATSGSSFEAGQDQSWGWRKQQESSEERSGYPSISRRDSGSPAERNRSGRGSGRFAAEYEEVGLSSNRGRKSSSRRSSRFEVDDDEFDDDDDRYEQKRAQKQKKKARAAARHQGPPSPILLPEFISVANLAMALRVKIDDIMSKMEDLGYEDTSYDYVLDGENAGLIAMEYNFEPIIDRSESQDLHARPPAEDMEVLPPRPPVVTIMGHVDHGKTTLLDYVRKSSVAATEHGGITQHIGAFSVPLASGKVITFLDTPGHAAFLNMRQRGADVTDIVILVVAADDSVKPQTIEAIKHALAAKVPIIVAINKIDKEGANIEQVKQDLARHEVHVEDYGGDTQVVCVSGKTGQGMKDLEDSVITLSEILDMRAETDGPVEGWVLESTTTQGGRVATVLVRRGTLRPGDVIVAGNTWSRVRRMRNEAGLDIEEAGPGTPVEVDGWRDAVEAGDEVLQAPDETKAKDVVDFRLERDERLRLAEDMEAVNIARRQEQEKREREARLAALEKEGISPDEAAALEEDREQGPTGPKKIYFTVKGDVSGSVEAVVDAIGHLGNDEVRASVLRSSVGPINETDIELASLAGGYIVSFNIEVDGYMARLAEQKGVKILDHTIIYRLVDEVREKLSDELTPLVKSRVLGEAEIAQVFDINVRARVMVPVAGCKVRNGVIRRGAKVRVLRNKETIYTGSLSSLKHVKKDVTEMRKGTECGMGFEDWQGFQVGDQVQCFEEFSEKRTL